MRIKHEDYNMNKPVYVEINKQAVAQNYHLSAKNQSQNRQASATSLTGQTVHAKIGHEKAKLMRSS
jgi:hypothetical protein